MTPYDFNAILPILVLLGYGCLLLLIDLLIPADRKRLTAWLTLLGLAGAALAHLAWPAGGQIVAFKGMLVADGFGLFLNLLFLGTAALTVLLALNYLPRTGIERGEFYVLLLFTVGGMMLMAQAADLIIVFLALELLSIPLYILSGLARPKPSSEESSFKYFLLGAFASAFLVYGIALIYGATGATNLRLVLNEATLANPRLGLLLAGVGLVLVGLGFKVAAVPFHMWTPDVYDGAPSVVTGFMSVGAKAGGFAALLRVFVTAFPALAPQWMLVAAALSALTMIVGNFAAIVQTNIKRLLAYSSIAHAGYILMGLVAAGSAQAAVQDAALGASLVYLLAYAVTNLGAWAVVIAVERAEGGGLTLNDYAGLGKRRPGLALAMMIFMFSLTGVPPTIGFVGKAYIFGATLQAGYVWLAVVGVLTSLVSAYYYLRVIVIMYMQEGQPVTTSRPALNFTVGLTALATVVLGLLPYSVLAIAGNAIAGMAR
ncbi:MAG: NADH-quinone oxidoreductase subunit N [Anaerolineales bacterium]|nr:NADH-quinone oxidoreductase subunit N [Anaerolineales bacterium]